MSIDDFCKFMNLPKMEKLGSLHGFTWYIEKDPPEGANGLPSMVRENIRQNIFEVLNSDQIFKAMELFW